MVSFSLKCPQAEVNYEEVLRLIYKTKWRKHLNKEKLRLLVSSSNRNLRTLILLLCLVSQVPFVNNIPVDWIYSCLNAIFIAQSHCKTFETTRGHCGTSGERCKWSVGERSVQYVMYDLIKVSVSCQAYIWFAFHFRMSVRQDASREGFYTYTSLP